MVGRMMGNSEWEFCGNSLGILGQALLDDSSQKYGTQIIRMADKKFTKSLSVKTWKDGVSHGRAVQVDPAKPMLKAPET
jgi:hypothetical protein